MTQKNRFPLIVKGTAAITAVLTAVFSLWHAASGADMLLTFAITAGTCCYHFSMRLAVGYLIPAALNNHADPKSFWFRSHSFEAGLYRRLKVKQWKGHMPTYSPESFSIAQNTTQQIIQNSCAAELVHETIIALSFLPLLAAIPFGALPVFLATSVLAAAYDAVFVIMQRYNRPRLLKLVEKQSRRSHP